MASLNWVVLDKNTLAPVPLPREKMLLSLSSVSLSLTPSRSPKPLPADPDYKVEKGTVYLSNQRVVYVSPPSIPTSDSGTTSTTTNPLETLSVPYTHFQDGRLNQPFFGANNFEATCLPAPEGGLSCPHVIRLYFKEGGGFDFYSTVLEMKERLSTLPQGGPSSRRSRTSSANNVGEDLPLYTPDSSSTPSNPSQPTSTRSQPRAMPSTSDLQAASIAREAELEEDDQRTRPNASAPPPPPPGPRVHTRTRTPPPIGNDAPPGYTPFFT
ncbi:hypothetical protein JCM16303_001125 [Sporobolomyces ruberrimus]